MHPDWLLPGPFPPAVETEERCRIEERLNDPAVPDVSLARAVVASGVTTRLHALDGITERYIIIRGEGLVEVGGRSWRVVPGDRVTIAAGIAQRITNTGARPLEFDCICTPRFVPDAYRDLDS